MSLLQRAFPAFFLLLFCCLSPVRADIVTGCVVDAQSGEVLSEVEVKMVRNEAMGYSWHTLKTDSLGRFKANFSGNDCYIQASLVGYHPRRVAFSAMEGTDTLDLGRILLKPSEVFLRTAVVGAKVKRFVMRGDTVVFNPEAFQLSEGARLSELVRKLPGVTEKEGKLYWMDKPVRILVNGEEMFADNQLLYERLPAEAVDRIKAYNKASRLQEKSGRDDGEKDHVLDIQIKPGFLEKWYGSAEAAYQTKRGYLARLDAMFMSEANPMMAFGNFNNVNAQIFQKSYSAVSMGSRAPFGEQQFGSLGYKHQWTTQQGAKKLKHYVAFSAQGQHTDGWGSTHKSRETFMPGEARSFGLERTDSRSHLAKPDLSFRSEFWLDSLTLLNASGGWNYEKGRDTDSRLSATFDADPYAAAGDHPLDQAFAGPDPGVEGLVARSRYNSERYRETMNTNARVALSRFFTKNSVLRVEGRMGYTDRDETLSARRELRYFGADPSGELRLETDRRPAWTLTAGVGTFVNFWLGEHVMMKLGYDFDHTKRSDRQDHSVDEGLSESEAAAAAESGSYRYRHLTRDHRTSLGATLKWGRFKLMPEASYRRKHEEMAYRRGRLDVSPRRDLDLWRPSLGARWDVRRGQNIEASYAYDTSAPDLLKTVGYTDDTDPLFVEQGNPLLRNTHTHSADLSYFVNNVRRQRSLTVRLEASRFLSPIGTVYFFRPATGAYRTMPMNLPGGDRFGGSLRVDQALGDYVRVSNSLSLSHMRAGGYLTADYDDPQLVPNRSRRLNFTEVPRISFEKSEFSLSLEGKYAVGRLRYSASPASNSVLTEYGVGLYGHYKLKDWAFTTRFALRGYAGYTMTEMNRAIPDWSLQVERKVLKGKGRVKLEADDVLNKKRNYWSLLNSNERVESSSERIHHYVRLHFSYNFDAKQGKQKK